jgi:asparagine synthase (glutamine-hydrolysing)
MDSTSIVCISDSIRKQGGLESQELLETVSYYSDSEPAWDERQYFSATEQQRGKAGLHIPLSLRMIDFEPLPFSPSLPGYDPGVLKREQEFDALVKDRTCRTILSGIGGDELLGGVPTPMPELSDYLTGGHLAKLLYRATQWCLLSREPLFHMLWKVFRFTASLYSRPRPDENSIPPWLNKTARISLAGVGHRSHLQFRTSPSLISNELAWQSALKTMPHLFPRLLHRYEFRYPYLDRDLVEFLLRVPRSQIVIPGCRRYLMRRSLKHIVPRQILDRRRKAFVIRGLLTSLQSAETGIRDLFRQSRLVDCSLIDPDILLHTLVNISAQENFRWARHLRATVALELWMQKGLPPGVLS